MTAAGSAAASPAYQFPSFQDPPQQQQQPQGGGTTPLWPEGDEAETLLDVYRKHLGHLFPFTVVPPHLSAPQLRAQRPLLWKAVMMEACLFDGPRQVALGTELLREISEAAFMKPQKNLDLLQGLQMLIAWLVSCCAGLEGGYHADCGFFPCVVGIIITSTTSRWSTSCFWLGQSRLAWVLPG